MDLSPAELARLEKLKARRDALIGGDSVKRVASGARSMEMGDGDAAALQAEIDLLETRPTGRPARRRGALTFRFRS